MSLLYYKIVVLKTKMGCIVLHELAMFMTRFMKKYFNSFDDIQFFHTFSSISRDYK